MLGIQMHKGGCAVMGSQMAELNVYQHDSEMTRKSSQFALTVISLFLIINIFLSTIYGILAGHFSLKTPQLPSLYCGIATLFRLINQ